MCLALITPTGGRPKQIKLCAEWMRKQTYAGEVLWIIVDDCSPTTTEFIAENFRENWTIVKVFPTPKWKDGQNTQARNLLAAIDIVKKYSQVTSVFVIEDDDYYREDYLAVMVEKLNGFDVAAQVDTLYFNVVSLIIKDNKNRKHGSLFQTAFVINMLPYFEKAVQTNHKFIDSQFWKNIIPKNTKIHLFEDSVCHSLGIKGLPGRNGIGFGHSMGGPVRDRLSVCRQLNKLIGTDYLYYL